MPKTSSGTTSAAAGSGAAAAEKVHTEHDALTSMRFASQMCFVAVAYDVLLAIILDDDSVWWTDEPFTWVEYVDVFDSLNWFVFGIGLLRATDLYGQTLRTLRRDDTVRMETVRDLCRIMSRIWRTTSWALVGVSASLAATLQEHAKGSGDSSSSKARMIGAPVALLMVAALGNIGVRWWSAQNATRAIAAAKKKEEEDVKPFSDEAAKTRSIGLRNCVSMNLCMASYALMGLMQLATWIVMPAGVVGRISTVYNFLTPFTICGLLLSLSKSFLRTLIAITGGGSPSKHVHGGNMFEAQTVFFTKIGNTLRSKVVFGLLPFVYAAAVKGFHVLVG